MPYKIGIAVYNGSSAGAGKSTLAQRLATTLCSVGYRTAVVPFAKSLKDVVNDGLSLDREMREAYFYSTIKEWGYTVKNGVPDHMAELAAVGASNAIQTFYDPALLRQRRILQEVGQMWRDVIDGGIWIDRWYAGHGNADIVIADDVRYDNEALRFDLLIGLDATALGHSGDTHSSEAGVSYRPDLMIKARNGDDAYVRLVIEVLR